jgi:hypothetical protein
VVCTTLLVYLSLVSSKIKKLVWEPMLCTGLFFSRKEDEKRSVCVRARSNGYMYCSPGVRAPFTGSGTIGLTDRYCLLTGLSTVTGITVYE